MSDVRTLRDASAEDNVDGVGEGLVRAMPGADAEGLDEKTPFIALLWIMAIVALIVSAILSLTFFIPYFVTGHWPY